MKISERKITEEELNAIYDDFTKIEIRTVSRHANRKGINIWRRRTDKLLDLLRA